MISSFLIIQESNTLLLIFKSLIGILVYSFSSEIKNSIASILLSTNLYSVLNSLPLDTEETPLIYLITLLEEISLGENTESNPIFSRIGA